MSDIDDLIAASFAPAEEPAAERPAAPVAASNMNDFVAEHRAARMPAIQRQNQIIERLQDAGYGIEQRRK